MGYQTPKHMAETLRDDLSVLSRAIASLLTDFEKQTGVRIDSIQTVRQSIITENGVEYDFRYAVKSYPSFS